MPEKIATNDLMTPLEMLEEQLNCLESFYKEDRFENKQDAEKMIQEFKNSIAILKTAEED